MAHSTDSRIAPVPGECSRFAWSPEWFLTPTGITAVFIGTAVALVRLFSAADLWQGRVAEAAVAGLCLIATGFSLAAALRTARDKNLSGPLRRAWELIGAGLALLACGVAGHLAALWIQNEQPVLSGYLLTGCGFAAAGLVLLALLRLPAGRLARRHRVSALLDLGTLGLAGFVAFWIYTIAPIGAPPLTRGFSLLVIVLHAVVAMALLCAASALYLRPRDPAVRHGFHPLLLGIAFLVVLDLGPFATAVNLDGPSARPPLTGWSLFALAAAVAARGMRFSIPVPPAPPREPRGQMGVPVASTLLVGFLLSTSLINPELWQSQIKVLAPATFIALALIVTRQTLTARDNLRLAHEMKAAKEVAETANTARLQFLANISHDLRTPLNGVLGCAQILLRDKAISPKQRELIRTMQTSAEHLRNLINDLLDLSKLEADKLELSPTAFELRSFLDDLVKTFAIEAEKKKVVLELRIPGVLPGWIVCDRKRLQQILGNLVHNAIKFTERGSVHVRVQAAGAELVIEVTDTGCGIMPDKLGELFLPFHVVDPRSIKLDGTGLGLSICKKLARRMGGDISVQSVVSKGSTFTVHLPLKESAPVVEVHRTIVDYQGRRRRILIVDDQPANRIVLRTMLEPLDFLVDEAADAAAAIEQVRFARPDVILLDLMMPGVDGFELLRQIQELPLPALPPCLAVSALSGEEVERRCRDAGFRQLLNKPVNFDLLTEALHTHAGIEWTHGVLQPAPPERETGPADRRATLTAPPPAEIAAFLDLARRGFVRNLEGRADQLAQQNSLYTAFADRVRRHARAFELKELADWLAHLSTDKSDGST